MKSLSTVVAIAVLAGFLRTCLGPSTPPPVTPPEAASLAASGCLPRSDLALGEPVSLSRLQAALDGSMLSPPPAQTLRFEATAGLQFEPVEGAVREMLADGGAATLPAGTVVRVNGGEFVLSRASALARRPGGREMLLRVPDSSRFRAAPGATYEVRLAERLSFRAGTPRSLPVGTSGILVLPEAAERGQPGQREGERQPLSLVPTQPLAVRPWVAEAAAALVPVRASTLKGLGDASVETREPGLNFGAPGLLLSGCAWTSKWGPATVGITEAKAEQPGAATVALTLPGDVVHPFANFSQTVRLLVATSDGQYVGHGSLNVVARGWAGISATGFVGVLLYLTLGVLAGRSDGVRPSHKTWAAGLFIRDGAPSLSLFQIFFWTLIAVWGLLFVYIVTGTLLSMTTSMLSLLGIAGTGSVIARWLGVRNASPDRPTSPGPPRQNLPEEVDLGELLRTDGSFDPLKLQLLIFTIIIGTYVVWRVADTGAFPDLDTNTLLLLGISQGVYLGGKVASQPSGIPPRDPAPDAKLPMEDNTAGGERGGAPKPAGQVADVATAPARGPERK